MKTGYSFILYIPYKGGLHYPFYRVISIHDININLKGDYSFYVAPLRDRRGHRRVGGRLKERDHVENQDADGRIILN
jgi:hypothetical protein